ncbi:MULTISPECIES: caspase family protein [Bradyrhizobium]|uniref:Caspase family protein n=1 Tax=Bradyrhizobium barranii subsp. barranii TaxID=2823807 RepID=A0A7Z0TQ59_9BRAD|nr:MULTISPECIES: caspase family protein [Bradyrhizobium]MBR0947640.1 caspase family protein [Bradyrhizobium liaoningense]MBR1002434.1 caspase family protein [Bradyrhizobium liaoningense]MCP1747129.1 putative caspase-like protein [Bradyrhizobium japonicum]MCP1865613.1 putative caspase-like protein [Bradyrhizobium japonicum]MCP1895616.1 putative caspase-like protein [Bradyrhizobium japonicum]
MLIVTTLLVLASSAFGHGPKQPLVEKPPTITSGRLALVKANEAYPDAEAPLANTGNDGSAVAAALRRNGYDVAFLRDAAREQISSAVELLESKIRPGSTVFLWFGGYGIQSRNTNYLLPVDSAVSSERDVRTYGLDVETFVAPQSRSH